MWRLRFALLLYAVILLFEAFFMLGAPARVLSIIGVTDSSAMETLAGYFYYILALGAAGSVAAALLIIIGCINPGRYVFAVRFALLWTGLATAAQVYALIQKYVGLSHVWWSLAINGAFTIVFLLLFPWRWRREMRSD